MKQGHQNLYFEVLAKIWLKQDFGILGDMQLGFGFGGIFTHKISW
jgi:hypothetical protein